MTLTAGQPMSQWPSTHRFVIPVAPGPERVTITIDGREVEAPNGELLIRAAQDHGTYIPRFCWHERMKPVGMCRMCLVEVDGLRGLQISCATPITDGMVVHTRSDAVKKVQDGMLELLLINHPLDCPVCDRGGECPLQDQTLAFGPGESRFVEEKRHFEKPIAISDLVLLDRERCIQCGRCTRFASEIVGDPLIDFGGRGGATEVITYPDEPFTSYFSGNVVQICPVGALTARPYRFAARPWDLASMETSCTACAVGCRGALESSSNRLVRLLGVDSEPVNHGWLCDKGRFGFEHVHSSERVRSPMVRKGTGAGGASSELVECSWPEALDAAAEGMRKALELHGSESIAVLGGARGTNEDAYVWARFAKGVLGTDNVDAQLGDGLPAEVVLGLRGATIADCDRAAAIVLLGPDLKEELPVLFLRVRRAAEDLDVPLIDVAARDHALTPYAGAAVRVTPGEEAVAAKKLVAAIGGAPSGDDTIDGAAGLLNGREGPIVVVLGRPSVAESADAVMQAAGELVALGDRARFLFALRRGNVRGALDLGLAPGFLPGRVSLADGREWFEQVWGSVPASAGLDAVGILTAARQGKIHALVLLGAEPIDDFPDRTLARDGLAGAGFVVAVGAFVSESTRHADVFLPVTLWGEQAGTTTNLEGRVQRVPQLVAPDGSPLPDWRVAAELAARLGSDFDLETVEEIQDEIARVAPAHAGIDSTLLRRARDGAVLPMVEHADELVLDAARIPLTDASWEPIHPSPLAASLPGDEPPTWNGGRDQPADEPAALPRVHVWSGRVESSSVPPRDAYALRLVAGRTLYDAGRAVAGSPSLHGPAPGATLLVNRADRERVGVPDGGEVRVTTNRGSLVVTVRADTGTPAGVVFLAFNQGGPGPSDLIDATAPVTDLRVETVR
jgi:NADH-quinone oxidoreductase subunit G